MTLAINNGTPLQVVLCLRCLYHARLYFGTFPGETSAVFYYLSILVYLDIHTFHTPTLHPFPSPFLLCPSITGYNHPVVKEALASNSLSTLVNRPALLVLPPMDFVQRIKNTLLSVSQNYAFIYAVNIC